jgi:hypothetical protein
MFVTFISLHILFCTGLCFWLFLQIGIVQSLNLFWIQIGLLFIKGFGKLSSVTILFLGLGLNFFFSPCQPNNGTTSGQHAWPMPTRPGLHHPHDEQCLNQDHAAAMRKTQPFFLISNESVMNPNRKWVEWESAPIMIRRMKNPYIRSRLEQFSPSKLSSSPSPTPCQCCTAIRLLELRWLSMELHRSPPPPWVLSSSPEVP